MPGLLFGIRFVGSIFCHMIIWNNESCMNKLQSNNQYNVFCLNRAVQVKTGVSQLKRNRNDNFGGFYLDFCRLNGYCAKKSVSLVISYHKLVHTIISNFMLIYFYCLKHLLYALASRKKFVKKGKNVLVNTLIGVFSSAVFPTCSSRKNFLAAKISSFSIIRKEVLYLYVNSGFFNLSWEVLY